MTKFNLFWLLTTVLLTATPPAHAQQPGKTARIGYLTSASGAEIERRSEPLRQGLRELGYSEGKNIAFVFRTSEGKSELHRERAAELVALKVDIIVTDNTSAALAAKKTTNTIPIVMTTSTDPVETGLVDSLARPGGNVTGLTNVGAELGGKLLELLKETVPRLSHVAILTQKSAAHDAFMKETEGPARALGLQLNSVLIRGPSDLDAGFRTIAKEKVNGFMSRLQPNTFSAYRGRVAEFANKQRLPSISSSANWVEAGGLMSYGSDLDAQARRAAVYIDKILKGTKPADLPVEAPMKYLFAINLKTAKQIGVTFPPMVLTRAERVIR